jgi:hypothetical protein
MEELVESEAQLYIAFMEGIFGKGDILIDLLF